MQRISKKLILAALLSFFILIFFSACKDHSTEFRFVFMTDIHVQPERQAAQGFKMAIEAVNRLNPAFVITGGDLIMDALQTPADRVDSLYILYQDLSAAFKMPVYNTMGNHEVFGLYEASGISPENRAYGKQMFRDRLGNGTTYYSFDYKGWHFIVLDGIGFTAERRYYGHVDSLQLNWLKNDIAAVDPSIPVVLSTHIPLFSVYGQMKNGPMFAMGEGGVVTNALEVINILAGHNLKLVLQGHLHVLEEMRYGNTTFITGGAVCGAWWKGSRDGTPEGFLVVEVKHNDFSWEYKTYGWQVRNAD